MRRFSAWINLAKRTRKRRESSLSGMKRYAFHYKKGKGSEFWLTVYQQHNVFMRVEDPDIQKLVGQTQPVEVMRTLREMKDRS
jgi:hypothetical protein